MADGGELETDGSWGVWIRRPERYFVGLFDAPDGDAAIEIAKRRGSLDAPGVSIEVRRAQVLHEESLVGIHVGFGDGLDVLREGTPVFHIATQRSMDGWNHEAFAVIGGGAYKVEIWSDLSWEELVS